MQLSNSTRFASLLLVALAGLGVSGCSADAANEPTSELGSDVTIGSGGARANDARWQDLIGLHEYGPSSDAPRIKQLQDDLVTMGYLPASIRTNVGYGSTFGPKTLAAVEKLQSDAKLPVTGVVDHDTAQELAPSVGAPPPAPAPPAPSAGSWPGAPAGDPSASALIGLAAGSSAAALIKELQDDLVRMGCLPSSFPGNPGYGYSFGPVTTAALEAFQSDNGLPLTGRVDSATAAALGSPRPLVASFAVGAAQAHRGELGLTASGVVTQGDGSRKQSFDHGYVMLASNELYVRDASGKDLAPPLKLGVASTVAGANAFFVSQWGPTPWNDAAGAPDGYEDCGPTTVLITLSMLGVVPQATASTAEATIIKVRGLTGSPAGTGTGYGELQSAITKLGGASTYTGTPSHKAIDDALTQGKPVIQGSTSTWTAWGSSMHAAGTYLNSHDPGRHWITILGRSGSGGYIVGDPLSTIGAIEVTSAQIDSLLTNGWDTLAISQP